MASDFSKAYPNLHLVTRVIDDHLRTTYPKFFGTDPLHPFLPLKHSKVIHDNLWGTNAFSWRELAIIDTPVFQRLRNIHQTGLAYFVYPCAHHTRFEHSLGVCIMASRVFDALVRQQQTKLRKIAQEIYPKHKDFSDVVAMWRAELRLAALLHDTGHSLHSHTSEIVYSKIPLLQAAAKELSNFVGTTKGAGEVLSYCISRTDAMRGFLDRARKKVRSEEEIVEEVDIDNASLLIVGRSKYPQLQFLGDIISSDLDADKLDYLLRDATAAGLPLRYDLERYFYTVKIVERRLSDGEGRLQNLYEAMNSSAQRNDPSGDAKYPYYRAHKLQLPRQAINTIEQIIICKFMLSSYIYHHKKVRAAEGMLARLIRRAESNWRAQGMGDSQVIRKFLSLSDHSLEGDTFQLSDKSMSDYRERIVSRVLPREVVALTSNVDHPENAKLAAFMSELLKKENTPRLTAKFETALGLELLRLSSELGSNPDEALAKAGAWFDAPKPPTFDKLEELLIEEQKITDIFPITSWIQAYMSYRYFVRVFAFSEYSNLVRQAARKACQEVIGISDPKFVDGLNTRWES
jgi:HD superfamily phosphohydrolase